MLHEITVHGSVTFHLHLTCFRQTHSLSNGAKYSRMDQVKFVEDSL